MGTTKVLAAYIDRKEEGYIFIGGISHSNETKECIVDTRIEQNGQEVEGSRQEQTFTADNQYEATCNGIRAIESASYNVWLRARDILQA